MKKLIYSLSLLLVSQLGFGQAVNDQAIIPVSVTLNSILRLTVVSGGNIDFVVNTIDQYTYGISTSAQYQTNFTVSSSRDFDVTLQAEDLTFLGQDSVGNSMPLNNVGFGVDENSIATGADGTNWDLPATILALTSGSQTIVTHRPNQAAGDVGQNNFLIQWRLGTREGAMLSSTLLSQSIAPDRYITNVFINLIPQ